MSNEIWVVMEHQMSEEPFVWRDVYNNRRDAMRAVASRREAIATAWGVELTDGLLWTDEPEFHDQGTGHTHTARKSIWDNDTETTWTVQQIGEQE